MKLLERHFNQKDTPVHIGSALLSERPIWQVTCVIKRQEVFGLISTEESYEVQATNEEKARESVRSFVFQSHPECSIESMEVTRRSRL